MYETDTIAAIATPAGRGGVSIIRVSGPAVTQIAETLLNKLPPPRQAIYSPFRDPEQNIIDHGIALFFAAPHSFTGEDVLELHGHGGMVIADMILQAALSAGARMARPGEFSERAFLNDKMDLLQAEAVVDVIDAGSRQAARAAMRTLEGEFSRRIRALVDETIQLRMYVESAMDFADEEIDFIAEGEVAARVQGLLVQLQAIEQSAQRGRVLGEGLHLVIAGLPNAGKSSLMNALSQRDSSIVTDIPGTTRDIIREQIVLSGIPIHLHDTAGLREQAEQIEEEGIRRAREKMYQADLILWLHDDTTPLSLQYLHEYRQTPTIIIRNKIDRSGKSPEVSEEQGIPCIALSARTGQGLDLLQQQLVRFAGLEDRQEGDFSARRRHLKALQQADEALRRAGELAEQQVQMDTGSELLAEELRQVQQALNEITGEFTADDLLGKIFAEFCIGK